MISKILVFSRSMIINGIQLFKEQKVGLISIISYPTDVLLTFDFVALKGIKHFPHLTACFSDVTRNEKGDFLFFNESHAKRIIEFVNEIKENVDTLIIHCDAGESRSGAVGLWANRYLGLDENTFLNHNKRIYPNYDVYRILYIESGMQKDKEDEVHMAFEKKD